MIEDFLRENYTVWGGGEIYTPSEDHKEINFLERYHILMVGSQIHLYQLPPALPYRTKDPVKVCEVLGNDLINVCNIKYFAEFLCTLKHIIGD
jgi:hypothetical protein